MGSLFLFVVVDVVAVAAGVQLLRVVALEKQPQPKSRLVMSKSLSPTLAVLKPSPRRLGLNRRRPLSASSDCKIKHSSVVRQPRAIRQPTNVVWPHLKRWVESARASLHQPNVAEAEVLLAPEVDVVGVQKAVKAALVKAALVAIPKLEGDVVQLVDVEEEVAEPNSECQHKQLRKLPLPV